MSFDCCGDPKPRISDLDGRFFCANCHTWLSVDIEPGDGTTLEPTDIEDVDNEREHTDD